MQTTLQQDYAVTNKRTLREATAQAVAQFLLAGGTVTVAKTAQRTRQALSKHMGRTNKFGISR
jgi:hypothetical protein